MSWLSKGLTQSVTGRISQLGGQLKDILTEGVEDVVDPMSELKVVNEKLKEKERHIEALQMESARWQEETSELSIKCRSLEAQLEQRLFDNRLNLSQKDAQIADLRKQIENIQSQTTSSAEMSRSLNLNNNLGSSQFQKSALMEEFEDIMPQSEFSDYLNLQKEIKRLNEDNIHLSNENKTLLSRLKNLEAKTAGLESQEKRNDSSEKQLEATIDNLNQEIFSLKNRLEMEKDKHQEEIISIQSSYKDRLNESRAEVESLKSQLDDLLRSKNAEAKVDNLKISASNKSDDGWCLNDEEINLDGEEKSEKASTEIILGLKNEEIAQLKKQIEMFENELEQANGLILKLKTSRSSASPRPVVKPEVNTSSTQTTTIQEFNLKKKEEIDALSKQIEELKINLENEKKVNEDLAVEKNKNEKEVDALRLELKQAQQSLNQEKMMQMQEQKHERQDMAKLKSENTELKIKLDEKLSEIKLLGDQINELNMNLNSLKSADSSLFSELQQKTQQFLTELDSCNQQIALLKSDKEALVEQRKQFEFVLEEKTRELSQLKADVTKHMQHIGAQSKAIEKLQNELRQMESEKASNCNEQSVQTEASNDADDEKQAEELAFFKEQYNQIYTYLEQKNQESLSYYNEIQRLNLLLSELNLELQSAKNMNEHLTEQYDNLLKEVQVEQKMVDDLNEQTSELNKTLLSTSAVAFEASRLDEELKAKREAEASLEEEKRRFAEADEKSRATIEKLQIDVNQLLDEKDEILTQSKIQLAELNASRDQAIAYYENQMQSVNEAAKRQKVFDEQQNQKLVKELERLREHLVEMSDSYNKEAILAEEREKQLRLALNDAQQNLQLKHNTLENSSKELELKLEQFSHANQELKKEKENLKERLRQSEESLSHQNKVTKNLELVLERLQNEKDSQNSIEISKYQQTIKENAVLIHNLQKEIQNHKSEINNLNESLEEALLLEAELSKKEENINQLKSQIGGKDALIENLEKRVSETQKVNDSYIEKDIIKNLIIGYIKVGQSNERKQVLKLISLMLNFSPSEVEQVEKSGESNWFGTFLKQGQTNKPGGKSTAENSFNKSFTELLIQYVDRESKPKPNLAFDLTDPNISNTNKKTDSPLPAVYDPTKTAAASLSNSSASAVKFFNNNLTSPTSATLNNDLTLINRAPVSASQTSLQQSSQSIIDQILK